MTFTRRSSLLAFGVAIALAAALATPASASAPASNNKDERRVRVIKPLLLGPIGWNRASKSRAASAFFRTLAVSSVALCR